ncbi:MAG: uL15m family ribosomal protein [Candidatus Aenigmatarchaeota archaeon]
MVQRFRKKITRQRGRRWHGWGSKKKHRGGGSRGGRGKAGMFKHKKSWALKHGYVFGKRGFKLPEVVKRAVKSINVQDLDELCRKRGIKEVDVGKLGYGKVLGSGKITQAITVRAMIVTPKAKEKIEAAGGKIILPESE